MMTVNGYTFVRFPSDRAADSDAVRSAPLGSPEPNCDETSGALLACANWALDVRPLEDDLNDMKLFCTGFNAKRKQLK